MQILVIGNTAQAAWLTSRLRKQNMTVQWWDDSATASFTIQHGSTSEKVENLPLITDLHKALEPMPDWVIMATSGWQIDAIAMQLLQIFPMGNYPKFLCLTHGLGPTAKLRTFFGEKNVVRGVMGAQFRWQDQNVHISGKLGIVFSDTLPPSDLGPISTELLWDGSVSFADDKDLLWSDVFSQLQANALPSILDVPTTEIYENSAYFDIEYQQIKEALAVIRHERANLVSLPGMNVPRLAQMVRWLPKIILKSILKAQTKEPTLKQDLIDETGRSDAAYLNGAVAYIAHENNLANMPINHALAVVLTDIAEKRAAWDQYKGDLTQLQTIIRIMSRH